nr:hypothetical protein [uncultured Methanobrevibacter sp.]
MFLLGFDSTFTIKLEDYILVICLVLQSFALCDLNISDFKQSSSVLEIEYFPNEVKNMSDEKIQINNPSLEGVRCPKCGSKNYVIGETRSAAASVGKQLLFGGVGNMMASSGSKDDFEIMPVRFICRDCKEKFEALAEDAGRPAS